MMESGRAYPDERSGPFPAPPIEFVDRQGRDIEVRAVEEDAMETLVEMYLAFDPADRAQGIPPTGEETVRRWLDNIVPEGENVVAFHGDEAVGHAVLVPDGETAYELAIFVLQEYQRAGIGRQLMVGLLGRGERSGVEFVWLTVERWNHAAIGLYESVGFQTCGAESFEKEMSIRLSPGEREERPEAPADD